LRNGEDLTPEEQVKLDQLLQRSKRFAKAYQWKEEFRAIYEQSLTVEEGKHQIQDWLSKHEPFTVKSSQRFAII
jgi:transposase